MLFETVSPIHRRIVKAPKESEGDHAIPIYPHFQTLLITRLALDGVMIADIDSLTLNEV